MLVVCTGEPLMTILDTLVMSPPPWLESMKIDRQRTFWNSIMSSSV